MKIYLRLLGIIAGIAGFASAGTITLDYSDAVHISDFNDIDELTAAAVALNGGIPSDYTSAFASMVYNHDYDHNADTGSAAGFYDTDYTPNAEGTATITWEGPGFILGNYLLAKDGNYGSYLWDISHWNGTDTIVIPNPWEADPQFDKAKGFSHVSIWGDTTTRVPDGGTTAILIGLGLASLVIASRRIKSA